MELNKATLKKLRGLIVFTLVLLVALWKYEVVLEIMTFMLNMVFPFLLGGAIAFILNVPMCFFQKHVFGRDSIKSHMMKKLSAPLSMVTAIIAVIGIIGVVIFVVVPELGNTFIILSNNIQSAIPNAIDWATKIFQDNPEIIEYINHLEFNWDKIISSFIEFFRAGAGNVLGSTFEAAKNIFSGLTTFFIAFVFACYILLQKKKLRVQIQKVFYAFMKPALVDSFNGICSLTYKTFSSFLTGQCVEAVILGAMFFIALSVFKFPYALLIGVLIAFTALIPIFGAFIGCVVGAFLILVSNPMQAVAFVVLFLVLQQIEGNLIYPHVVGGSVGLPSIWVLVAVTIGGNLMGIVGMLIFIPIVSVVYTLFRELVYKRLRQRKIIVE